MLIAEYLQEKIHFSILVHKFQFRLIVHPKYMDRIQKMLNELVRFQNAYRQIQSYLNEMQINKEKMQLNIVVKCLLDNSLNIINYFAKI